MLIRIPADGFHETHQKVLRGPYKENVVLSFSKYAQGGTEESEGFAMLI